MATEANMMATRLDAVKEANKRVRLSFLLVTAAATIILGAAWNASLSWSNFAPRPSPQILKDADKSIVVEVEKERQTLLLNNQFLTIPLLGIRIAATDLPLIGSLTLLVLCFYYCSCTRLANQEVSSVLSQCKAEERSIKQFVYFTIRSSMVLNNPTLNDAPISRLDVFEQQPVVRPSIPRVFRLITYLPLTTVALAVAADILGTLLPDYRGSVPQPSTWMLVGTPARIQFMLTDIAAGLIGLGVLFFSRAAIRYNDASISLMLEFRADLWQ